MTTLLIPPGKALVLRSSDGLFGPTLPGRPSFDLPALEGDDRRAHTRYDVAGLLCRFHVGDTWSLLRIKNVSRGGIAGITEVPLAVGNRVYLQLGTLEHVAACVRWTRSALVGLKFVQDLDEHALFDLHAIRRSLEGFN